MNFWHMQLYPGDRKNEFDINKISIHRRELLTSDLIPLKDLGEIIE